MPAWRPGSPARFAMIIGSRSRPAARREVRTPTTAAVCAAVMVMGLPSIWSASKAKPARSDGWPASNYGSGSTPTANSSASAGPIWTGTRRMSVRPTVGNTSATAAVRPRRLRKARTPSVVTTKPASATPRHTAARTKHGFARSRHTGGKIKHAHLRAIQRRALALHRGHRMGRHAKTAMVAKGRNARRI